MAAAGERAAFAVRRNAKAFRSEYLRVTRCRDTIGL